MSLTLTAADAFLSALPALPAQLLQELGRRWKAVDEETKKKYTEMAEKAKADYIEKHGAGPGDAAALAFLLCGRLLLRPRARRTTAPLRAADERACVVSLSSCWAALACSSRVKGCALLPPSA